MVAYPDRGQGNDPEPFLPPYLLGKGGYFLVALISLSVCLFVCLSVDNITQKVINGLGLNFMDGS